MPFEWISNYENFKKNISPTIATEATFKRSTDGTGRTIFKRPNEEKPSGENPCLPYNDDHSWSSSKKATNPCY